MTSYDNSSKYSNLGFTGDSIIRVPAPVLVEHQRHKKEKYELLLVSFDVPPYFDNTYKFKDLFQILLII